MAQLLQDADIWSVPAAVVAGDISRDTAPAAPAPSGKSTLLSDNDIWGDGPAPAEKPSFLQEMGASFAHGIQSGKDLLSGDFQDINRTAPTPKTQALADKLFPEGSDGSFMDAVRHVGDTVPSDYSGALLEKFGETAEGKALAALAGVNPVWNAVSTVVNRYVNPAVSEATGIHEDNLALMEMGAGTLGLKGAGKVKDPTITAAKYAASKAAPAIADAASTVKSGIAARTPEVLQQTSEAMKTAGGDLYTDMRKAGAILNDTAAKNLTSQIDASIAKQQFIPQLNPKTLAVIEHLKEAINNGELGLAELDQYRRMLSRIGGSEDGVSAGAVKQVIDGAVNKLSPADIAKGDPKAVDLLNRGRAQYAKASKFEEVADIIGKAAGDPNKIKAGLTRFLNNKDNLRGFTTEEIAALKAAAESTVTEKLLKMAGKFGIDLGTSLTPGNTVGPLVGGYVNPILPVVGTVARQGQKYVARGKAEKLLKTIENRSAPKPTAAQIGRMPPKQAQKILNTQRAKP